MQAQTSDRNRTAALGAATAAFIAVPTLGPRLLGTTEELDRYDTVITPPGYAFSVWAPIFAACIASTVDAVRPSKQASPENRAVGWPLAGAYALNAIWSVAAQTDNFRYTPPLLPASAALTGIAHRRLQTSSNTPGRTEPTAASLSTGLLLGWISLAATVNVSAVIRLVGANPASKASVTLSTLGAAGTTAALCARIGVSERGILPLAATSSWGLATTALDKRRPMVTRLTAAVGATAILLTTATRSIRLRRATQLRPNRRSSAE